MKLHVLTVDLKDDAAVAAYTEHHRRVWPEVLGSLTCAGIRRMDIHLLGRRLVMLVGVDEGVDVMGTFATHMSSSPRVAEWEALMRTLQQPAPGARPGEWWAMMEPVFRLEDQAPVDVNPMDRGARR